MLNNASGFDKIYIACGRTDLRKGIDGLCTIIQHQLEIDPFQKTSCLCSVAASPIKSSAWFGKGMDFFFSTSGYRMAGTSGPDRHRKYGK